MDSENVSLKEAKFIFLVEYKSESFQFKETFDLSKGNYYLGSSDKCEIVLNLPEIDEIHAFISIENEDFSEITDISGLTYSILKNNAKTGSNIKIKKNVIYSLYGSCFSLGCYTKIFLYNEKEYFILKEKEKNDILFSIYNEVSLSYIRKDDQLYKKVFYLVENHTGTLEKNNLFSLCNIESISDILMQKEEKNVLKENSSSNEENMNIENSHMKDIDIEISSKTTNKKLKKNKSKKSYLLNQLDINLIVDQNKNPKRSKKSSRTIKLADEGISIKIEREKSKKLTKTINTNSSPNNTIDSEENHEGNEIQSSSKIIQVNTKIKRKIGIRELNGMIPVHDDEKQRLINLKQSEEIFKNIKKLKPFQNKRIYWHNNTPDAVKNLIESSGGELINNVENHDCIVICEKSNYKLINSMKKKGISCYSKQSILDSLRNEKTLDLEKYSFLNLGMLFK